jgi:carbonic anhydrase/acetyltransferase-like protein (isoleucine patch superfamily)
MGVPGQLRRKLGDAEQEVILKYARNYVEYKEQYLREKRLTSS